MNPIILALILVSQTTAAPSADPPPASDPSIHFLIIAPTDFHSVLADFVAFKRERLADVRLISLPDALAKGDTLAADYPGEYLDDPARLKHFLFNEWDAGRATHVLLVGDADVFPVRYMVLDRVTAPAFDYAFYPCDLYYADLARADHSFDDWNSSHGDFHLRYFGEVRGEKNKSDSINFDAVDYRPDVALGRWPVSTLDQLKTVADKTIRYELAVESRRSTSLSGATESPSPEPRPRGLGEGSREGVLRSEEAETGSDSQSTTTPRAALLSVGGWVDARPAMENLAALLSPTWSVDRRYYRDNPDPAAPDPYNTPPPDVPQLLALLNAGSDLVLHAGHGGDDVWGECLSVTSLSEIHNAGRLPVMFSAGCSTARFATLPPYEAYRDADGLDHLGTNNGEVFTAPPPPPAVYAAGNYNHTGLGERFLRDSPNGCVAYIGCNTGSQPCGLTLMTGFVRALHHRSASGAVESPSPEPRPRGLGEGSREGVLKEVPRLGDCWSDAVAYYYDAEHLATIIPNDDWYPASIFFQGMKFMLFGDPTIPLR